MRRPQVCPRYSETLTTDCAAPATVASQTPVVAADLYWSIGALAQCLTAMDEVIFTTWNQCPKAVASWKVRRPRADRSKESPTPPYSPQFLALARASSSCEPVQAAIGNAQIAVSDLVVSRPTSAWTPALAACPNRRLYGWFSRQPSRASTSRNRVITVSAGTSTIYEDRTVRIDDQGVTIRHYYFPFVRQVRPVLADRIRRPRSHVVAERAPTNLGNNRFQLVVQPGSFTPVEGDRGGTHSRRPRIAFVQPQGRRSRRDRNPQSHRITRRELTSGTRIRR